MRELLTAGQGANTNEETNKAGIAAMGAVLGLLSVVLLVWRIVRFFKRTGKGDDLTIMPHVDEEFRATVVAHELPELCFDGRSAEIVDERREYLDESSTHRFIVNRIHRFARNAHGEYFFFISDGSGTPFFKHVPHNNAKAALGNKYVAPSLPNG